MSTPTPQEIRDRLSLLEGVLYETWAQISDNPANVAISDLTSVLESKTSVLHAAALTLLVEQQQIANRLAAAQILATNASGYNSRDAILIAREILETYE